MATVLFSKDLWSDVSSNINEVIRAVLNPLFFLWKDFARTKSTKKQKDAQANAQKPK